MVGYEAEVREDAPADGKGPPAAGARMVGLHPALPGRDLLHGDRQGRAGAPAEAPGGEGRRLHPDPPTGRTTLRGKRPAPVRGPDPGGADQGHAARKKRAACSEEGLVARTTHPLTVVRRAPASLPAPPAPP